MRILLLLLLTMHGAAGVASEYRCWVPGAFAGRVSEPWDFKLDTGGTVTYPGGIAMQAGYIPGFTQTWELGGEQIQLSPDGIARLLRFADGEDRATPSASFRCELAINESGEFVGAKRGYWQIRFQKRAGSAYKPIGEYSTKYECTQEMRTLGIVAASSGQYNDIECVFVETE